MYDLLTDFLKDFRKRVEQKGFLGVLLNDFLTCLVQQQCQDVHVQIQPKHFVTFVRNIALRRKKNNFFLNIYKFKKYLFINTIPRL